MLMRMPIWEKESVAGFMLFPSYSICRQINAPIRRAGQRF
jgi:hypothetical protein